MDRADYFKKKGSTVDSKFARLHRRSIDQRVIRGKSFMDNRLINENQFSPLKENGAQPAMPPPRGAPPKAAKKGNAALNRSATKEQVKAPASKPAPVNPKPAAQGLSRKEKLMKWKEEKELKKRQMANSKKQQVFRVSASIDRHADTNLYVSSSSTNNAKKNTSIHHAPKGAPKPAPAPTRVTRSSARSNTSATKPKDTSVTRASSRHVESVPCKRPRPGKSTTTSKPAPTRPVPASRAPNTRQSARLAAKQPPPPRGKVPCSAGRGKKQVEETKKKDEELSHVEDVGHMEQPSQSTFEEPTTDETFVPKDSKGFTFTMELPDIPFTPISPASATNFLFPSAPTQALSFTPSQRRCSTPYSLRTRKSLARTPHQAVQPIKDLLKPTQPETRDEEETTNVKTEAQITTSESTTKVEEETQSMEVTVETAEPEINTEVSPVSKPMPVVMEMRQASTESKPTQADVESAETVTKVEESVPVEDAAMDIEEATVKVENSKSEAETNAESEKSAAEISAAPSAGEQKDVPYFKNLVSSETTRLLERCGVWEKIMTEHQISDEVSGEIRSSIGKAKLLIDQRFKQFLGLIKNCEFGLGEKVTHCSDLEGFWEMIYFQVEDVDALFKELEKLRDNNWEREQKPKPKVIKKKKPVTKKTAGGAAANRNAARERLLAAKAAMKAKATRQAESEKVIFEGGFFKVESPARKTIREHCEAGSPFRTSKRNTPASRTATPKFVTTPKVSKTPVSTRVQTTPLLPPTGTPTVAQLFSPMAEPRRSLRTKLCGEISKLVLSDKKPTPTRRTPLRVAKESPVAKVTMPVRPEPAQVETNKENDVDLSLYLMPAVNLQANDLMTEPDDQLMQLETPSPKKTLRPRRSSVKPKDPFSPSLNVCSQALHNATNLCSPVTRKTRKSSLGFGLSQAASLFTPTSTPEPQVSVADLISFD